MYVVGSSRIALELKVFTNVIVIRSEGYMLFSVMQFAYQRKKSQVSFMRHITLQASYKFAKWLSVGRCLTCSVL